MELTKKTIGQYLREQTAVIGDHTAMEMFGWSCSFAQLDEDIVHARELVTNIRERLTQQEEEQDLPGKPLVQPPEQRSRLDMTR